MCIDSHGHAVRCRECGDTGEFEALSGDTGPCHNPDCLAGMMRKTEIAVAKARRQNGNGCFCWRVCTRVYQCTCVHKGETACNPNLCKHKESCREPIGEGAE